jgi:hypothetical protein
MEGFAYVEAVDGERKRWQFDSTPYELDAGERKLFPRDVAEQARSFFTPHRGEGETPCSVLITPFDGEVELGPRAEAPALEYAGQTFETIADLVEAIQAQVKAEQTAAPQDNPPEVPNTPARNSRAAAAAAAAAAALAGNPGNPDDTTSGEGAGA